MLRRGVSSLLSRTSARLVQPSTVPHRRFTVDKDYETARSRSLQTDPDAEETGKWRVENYSSPWHQQVAEEIKGGGIRLFNVEREEKVPSFQQGVAARRRFVEDEINHLFENDGDTDNYLQNLPFEDFDYRQVHGQCCENVVGYVPIPVGVAGPLDVDGQSYYVPMATTEGALVASTSRGCKALSMSGGVKTFVLKDGMSRAPVLAIPSVEVGYRIKTFIDTNFRDIADSFAETSRFARISRIESYITGRKMFLRFKCVSGDAMGMNMVGKGVEHALGIILEEFKEEKVHVIALSGNVCVDKKPSAMNWIDGRGKSVVAEAVIPPEVVKTILKTTPEALVEVNYAKNLIGSSVAGSLGGQNAHASNVVTALFIACGQDPAQNVESSNCITLIEPDKETGGVYISVTMPSIEVGTVGGGTSLSAQRQCLEMLGVAGANREEPGANAKKLASIVAGTVMAGELSLLSALSAGHLIKSHMALNRKQ